RKSISVGITAKRCRGTVAYGDPTQIFSSRCLIVRVKKYARYEIVPAGSGVGSIQTAYLPIDNGFLTGTFLLNQSARFENHAKLYLFRETRRHVLVWMYAKARNPSYFGSNNQSGESNGRARLTGWIG